MTNIDKMDELGKNIPDDLWRKAFDEAAETPPPRVWNSIERRLNESNGPKVIPLWGSGLALSRPVIWGSGIAAALALLLVGWWVINTQSAQPSVAHLQPVGPKATVATAPTPPIQAPSPALSNQANETIASATINKSSKTAKPSSGNLRSQLSSVDPSVTKIGNDLGTQKMAASGLKATVLRAHPDASRPHISSADAAVAMPTAASSRMAVASFTPSQSIPADDATLKQTALAAFGQLKGKPLRLRSVGPIQRIVWYQPADLSLEAELIKETRKTREKWASASVMPGAFNPMVSMPSAQAGLGPSLAATTAKTNSIAINSRANFSVAYQATAGVQLTERWSVESGVGYLSGRSTVETPAQTIASNLVQGASADRAVIVSNLYADVLRNSSSDKMASNITASNSDILPSNNAYLTLGNYNNQTQQVLSNDYQYMQVPIQVGYQLRPRKRLSLAVLGGLLTNIFVRNTVGSDLIVTGKDGIYRPISLAATMGARFRYRPSGRWSASLAGLYQPALSSGTQSDSQLQIHPTSTGMSFGVDYHF